MVVVVVVVVVVAAVLASSSSSAVSQLLPFACFSLARDGQKMAAWLVAAAGSSQHDCLTVCCSSLGPENQH